MISHLYFFEKVAQWVDHTHNYPWVSQPCRCFVFSFTHTTLTVYIHAVSSENSTSCTKREEMLCCMHVKCEMEELFIVPGHSWSKRNKVSCLLPNKNWHNHSVLSPDAVVGRFFPDSVVSVVHVNGQVLVSVVRWAEVGDHTAGDPQETHHWTRTQRSRTTFLNYAFILFHSTSISFPN